jgi:hypothetical protein
MSRRRRAALASVLLAGGVALIWIGLRSPSAEERAATADSMAAAIEATVSVHDSRLLAARAIADFGVGGDVRLVLVRIVDELTIEIRIESSLDLQLAAPIRACLVGPDPAPDDAGLEDRCWGEGQQGDRLDLELARDDAGRHLLLAGVRSTHTIEVGRGDLRCDYAPGPWRLELIVDPIVAGEPAGPRYAPDATFDIPYDAAEPLRLVEERRYCGLASKIIREQGEPAIVPE